MAKVSILSAVYNEEQHVEEMIASVRSQTHTDWELLFVDDYSTDRTVDIILAAAGTDDRIRMVSSGGKVGKVKAFNLAFQSASGEYIILLAGDDRLPPNSLETRVSAVTEAAAKTPNAVAFFKIRTFSKDSRLDGIEIPRGNRSNKSGGSMIMTMAAGKNAFPIPAHLAAEDIWLRFASTASGAMIVEVPRVVLDYRIHEGNSNPRNRPFAQMSESIHKRHLAYQALISDRTLGLEKDTRSYLCGLWEAESLRQHGRILKLTFGTQIPLADRLSFVAMAHPALWRMRQQMFGLLSGRR